MATEDTNIAFSVNRDTSIIPISDVPEWVLEKLDSPQGEFVLSRPYGRGSALLVNSLGVRIVEAFRDGNTIPKALLSVSQNEGINADSLVRSVYPLLEKLIEQQFLVREDASREMSQTLPEKTYSVNDYFKTYQIVSKVQQYEDSAVYKVRLPDGGFGALKILRLAAPEIMNDFRREHAILVHLNGSVAPRVLDAEVESGELYIVTEWVDGCTILDWAAGLANLPHAKRFSEIKDIAIQIVGSYQQLHALGVIHSDIWGKNVLIDESKRVRLIDFGLSRLKSADDLYGIPKRGNAEFYKAPDLALAQLQKSTAPDATVASDIYSLGVLLYLIVVGKFHMEFSFEKDEQNRQVLEEPTLSFEERGGVPWPQMEALLRQMLERQSVDRLASLDGCVNQLIDMSLPDEPTTEADTLTPQDPMPFLRSYVGEAFDAPILAPTASLFMGVGGIGYSLFRAAMILTDSTLLREASYITSRARYWMDAGPEGSINPTTFIDREQVGEHTLFHHAEGISMLEALIAHASFDHATLRRACLSFINRASARPSAAEFMIGRSGILNAIRQLSYLVVEKEELLVAGHELADEILRELEDSSLIADAPLRFIGFAHGWAGILHTLLAWGNAYNNGLAQRLTPFLEQLHTMKVKSIRGSYWPRHLDEAVTEGDFSSWCSGTAGQIILWLEAFKATKDSRWLSNAVEAGNHVIHAKNSQFDLCCGVTGGALSLGLLYAATGDKEWLASAEIILSQAQPYQTAYIHSLFKGIPGIEVARLELGRADRMVFPLIASDTYGPPLAIGALTRQ